MIQAKQSETSGKAPWWYDQTVLWPVVAAFVTVLGAIYLTTGYFMERFAERCVERLERQIGDRLLRLEDEAEAFERASSASF